MRSQNIHCEELPPSPQISYSFFKARPRCSPSPELEGNDFSLEEPILNRKDSDPALFSEEESSLQSSMIDSVEMLDELEEEQNKCKRSYNTFLRGKSGKATFTSILSQGSQNSKPRKRINLSE